jgi:hypothetical protein
MNATPEINESSVPLEKRRHPKYQELFSKLQKELTAKGAIEIFSTHEAGHLIFFKRAGFTQFEFHGPTMTYDGERCGYHIAAVETPESSRIRNYNGDILDRLARLGVGRREKCSMK